MLESKNKVQANIMKSVEGGTNVATIAHHMPDSLHDSNLRFAKITQQASHWEQVNFINIYFKKKLGNFYRL